MSSQEISQDTQIKLFFEEAYLVYLNKLDLKKNSVDEEITKRSEGHPVFMQMVEDRIIVARGEEKVPIMQAKWNFLGQYGFEPKTSDYYWSWGWHSVPDTDDRYSSIREALAKLPEEISEIAKNNVIIFQDPMLVSFIQAFLSEMVPFGYIKILPGNFPETYSAFGLYDIKWLVEVLEPSTLGNLDLPSTLGNLDPTQETQPSTLGNLDPTQSSIQETQPSNQETQVSTLGKLDPTQEIQPSTLANLDPTQETQSST